MSISQICGTIRGIIHRRGQVALWVILALVIVGGALVYLFAQGELGTSRTEESFQEVYRTYEACIEQETRAVLAVAGTQAGYVKVPQLVRGSDYAPFSSQLDFLGFKVPYWQYVSGNGVVKEQVPKLGEIEQQLEQAIGQGVSEGCEFGVFAERGIIVNVSTPDSVDVKIREQSVNVEVDALLQVSSEDGKSAQKEKHTAEVKSTFGSLYEQARAVYDAERERAFLENYSVDVLSLYAPVDGVVTSCNPKVWKTREVVEQLKEALAANIQAVKLKGSYYTLNNEQQKYFVVDIPARHATRFLSSSKWASRIEIAGAGQELMIAEPVGIQQGLGVLGFCYAPYHFVYDVSYPVLVQVFEGEEMFQFPLVVVIDNNLPRAALPASIEDESAIDICEFSDKDITIRTHDVSLRPVDARVSYHCFEQECTLGTTNGGVLQAKAPACVNGWLFVQAEGYAPQRQLFSSNAESSAELILDRVYSLGFEVRVGGVSLSEGAALVSFEGAQRASAVYPELKNVSLSEGLSNVSVYVYGASNLTIPASKSRQCHEVRAGIIGVFGGKREECFDVELPATKIEQALIGGGSVSTYFFPEQLEKGRLVIDVPRLSVPQSLAQLQTNYELFALQKAEVSFP